VEHRQEGQASPAASGAEALTRGMMEIRHVGDSAASGAAYDALYADTRIANQVRHLDWLLDLMELEPGQRLLDVACGRGDLVRLARERGLLAQGVDLSRVALSGGLGRMPVGSLVAGDGQDLPFADAAFDRLCSIGSLEHYGDMLAGVSEMSRLLAPEGLALVLVPNSFGFRWNVLHAWRSGDIHDDGQPIQRYATRAQWTRLLAAGGLKVQRVLGSEAPDDWPAGPREWLRLLAHPSRLMIPLSPWLPPDMASMFVFLCRKTAS
jgi:SAM-dependent methyltransferase